MSRPSWSDYFFGMAKMVSARSNCPSRQVGAVLVDPETNFVLATGYNGAPRGTEHCGPDCASRESGKTFEKCKAIHAELNVLLAAALNGVRTNGAWLYLTTTPCLFCARTIIQAGIKKVLATSMYPHSEALDLLKSGGVVVEIHTGVPMPTIRLRDPKPNMKYYGAQGEH